MGESEKTKSDEAPVEKIREEVPVTLVPGKITPSQLGVLRFKGRDSKIYNFHGNRAQRRRYIREHKLVRDVKIPPVR